MRGVIMMTQESAPIYISLGVLVVAPVVAFVVLIIPAWLVYIGMLAMVEFVRVILDIEINTRHSARLIRIFVLSQSE